MSKLSEWNKWCDRMFAEKGKRPRIVTSERTSAHIDDDGVLVICDEDQKAHLLSEEMDALCAWWAEINREDAK